MAITTTLPKKSGVPDDPNAPTTAIPGVENSTAPPTPDPFASIGGGVYANGGWTPKGMNAPQEVTAYAPGPAPAGQVNYEGTAPAPASVDPFASIGGGVQTANGGWVPKGHPDAIAAQAAAPAPAAAAAPAPAGGGVGGSAPVPGADPSKPATINDAFRSALLSQLNTSTTVDPNDPTIKGQSDAFNLGQQRSQERSQNTIAEQSALDGTNTSGGFLSDKLGLEEGRAQAEGGFHADLVGKELQSRRDQIAQALSLGAGYLSDQEHQALQKQLADLDASIRREGLAVQSKLGQGDLAARDKAINAQSNLGLLEAMLNNEQSGNRLGFDYTQLQTNANRDAVLAALGR